MTREFDQITNSLIDIGLSEREARVYLALLNKHYATAADLQKMSGVPQSKIYETIGGLVRRGLCTERKVGRKRTFEIVDPDVTLSPLFKSLQSRLENALGQKKLINNLFSRSSGTTEPLEYIEVIRGNEVIHKHYCQLVDSAESELLGFGRGPYAWDSNEKLDEQKNALTDLIKRGGKSRWVFEVIGTFEHWLQDYFKDIERHDVSVRITDNLPLKMMIFDRRTVLVAQEDQMNHPGELTMSIIKQATIANAFCAMFEYFWSQSVNPRKFLEKQAS